jgi:hypothetical protein
MTVHELDERHQISSEAQTTEQLYDIDQHYQELESAYDVNQNQQVIEQPYDIYQRQQEIDFYPEKDQRLILMFLNHIVFVILHPVYVQAN